MSCLLRDPIKAFLLQDCFTFDKIVGKMEEMTHLFSSCLVEKVSSSFKDTGKDTQLESYPRLLDQMTASLLLSC